MAVIPVLRFPWSKQKKSGANEQARARHKSDEKQTDDEPFTENIEHTISYMRERFDISDDFVVRRIQVMGDTPAVAFYFPTLTNGGHQEAIKSFMTIGTRRRDAPEIDLKQELLNDYLFSCDGRTEETMAGVIEELLNGSTVVHVEGIKEAFVFCTRNVDKRSIDQPETEQVIRGPREGFIENLMTNISLIRYRLQAPELRIKINKIGKYTRSCVAVIYVDGIVNPALVEEVQHRLSKIEIDGIIDSGYVEQFIEDNHYSPFPQIQVTERPDKAVASLLEGRVVIMVDGSPIALLAPTVFSQFYQTTEDYAERFLLVSFIRIARLVALLFSLVFPALYVAVISFNPELIPTEFAVAVAGGRSGVPFPTVVEVLVMEISMEVLREATIRLPQQVGGALSIVGVLVVGQAAVSAGFVSPITVVIIALTTIGSFATPAYNAALALRLLRFPIIIIAGMFGLYGVMVGLILITNHMLTLKSFGVPYLSPIVPGNFEGFKDTVFRAPLWWMKRRPAMLHTPDKTRVGSQSYEQLERSKHNTLDPLTVGNSDKGGGRDGQSQTSDRDSSGDRHH
ncbi:spore germination protein [Paenibacillus ginsengarvi]|uniref:Spore germination protein n=1 Tax=Paenibacillus ginsengarvi TaxID=400777 RepID=A0A3B0CJ81_9BACL|nr:spore germination protein [Paenibacillus ginsengarvi]RKN85453.1 spore germination protein [Paenibacillus ginsengarvi]